MGNLADGSDKPRRLSFTDPDPRPLPVDKQLEVDSIAKRATKPERFRVPPVKRDRLPNGARFAIVFDAARVEWTGTLTVGEIVVEDRAGAAMTLLSVLDQKYRARVKP